MRFPASFLCGGWCGRRRRDARHADGTCARVGSFSKSKTSTYDDLFLTVSNVLMSFSDFPVEEDYIKYSRKEEYAEYLDRYAAHFDLQPKIRFGTTVSRAFRDGDG